MFTDIEGSTRLLGTLGADYGRLLADHHRLIVDNAASHHGVLVDTQGDACFVVFPTASQAIESAAGIQRALSTHPWPGGADVRVRIGLHTGAPVQMDDRYVGIDVHRAARISAVAHGGQVVASAPTVQLAEDDGHSWLALGDFRLKDLKRPERLYQLVAPGLTESHPSLKADRWGTELPEPPNRFVGRAATMEEAVDVLSGEIRVVTLAGPGGIGKTRLAVHIGRSWSDRFTDGVEFVSLATLSETGEVLAAVVEAVGATQTGSDDPLNVVAEHLRHRRMLLILDNMEHLLPAAGSLVADLARSCPKLRIVVTSRAPLGISGERLIRVPALALPPEGTGVEASLESESVALFVDRARAVDPGFRLSESNLDTVVEICRRLDGVPLALELAAARTDVLAPAELLDRLRLELLTSRSPDLNERQRTLASTIEWSYRLLDPPLQRVFREFSVFAGGAALEDIEAVVTPGGDVDTLEAVSNLVANSLLWRDVDEGGTSRFRMLEIVREFAQGELENSGGPAAVADRHAARLAEFLEMAEQKVDGPEASEWMAKMDTEMSNIRAALRWTLEDPRGTRTTGVAMAQALGWFWYVRGHASEGLRWLKPAIEAAADAPGIHRIRVTYYAGAMAERLGRFPEAVERFHQTLAICRELGDEVRTARALNSLGGMAIEMGDHEAATEYLSEAETILLVHDDDYGLGANRINQCDVAITRGELARARQWGESALDILSKAGNAFGEGVALRHLAKVAYSEGDLEEAGSFLKRALAKGHEIGDIGASARCLERLGGVEIALGRNARGLRLGAAAQRLRSEVGDHMAPERLATFQESWADARRALGEADFQETWEQGSHMTFDQAVNYAMED